MATRPIFVPDTDPDNSRLVHRHEVEFQWVPGESPELKRANIAKLHQAAAHRNLSPLLEVSPFGEDPLGPGLAVSRLTLKDDASYFVTVTALYYGSMVFSGGGPYTDLYREHEADISADPRLQDSGSLGGFRFQGLEWGLKAAGMFYDWLVIQAVHRHRKLSSGIMNFAGFTDLECLAKGPGICHARSCALYVALTGKNILDKVMASQDLFIGTLMEDPLYQT